MSQPLSVYTELAAMDRCLSPYQHQHQHQHQRLPVPVSVSASASALLLAGFVLLAGCRPVGPQAELDRAAADQTSGKARHDDAQRVFDDIIDEYLAASPVTATVLGEHRYDGLWPDLSPAAMTRDVERIASGLARLDTLVEASLSPDQRVDRDILRTQLELQEFDTLELRPWQHDPLFYVYSIGSGLNDLVTRDFAAIDQRAENLAKRLEGLPRFVDQGLVHLRRGPVMKPHAEVADKQLAGLLQLIEHELQEKVQKAPQATRVRISKAIPAALSAVSRLQTTLHEELLPSATHPWRLGPALYARKLSLTLGTDLTSEQVLAQARVTKDEILADMGRQARALYQPLFGEPAPARPDTADGAGDDTAGDAAVIRRVLEALADDHVAPDQLRDAAEGTLARLRAFVTSQGIIALDPSQVLRVIWTPAHDRGVAIAGLAPPGPLDADKEGLASFYLVQPIPETWSDDVRESFLREYNNFMMEVLSIHEAIPGHFVQLYYGQREPSKVRRVFNNGSFVEGWAVYSEQVMMEHGYPGAGPAPSETRPPHLSQGVWTVKTTPALRALAIALHRNKFWLRTTVNALLDHEVHAADMSEQQALALLMNDAFQQEGEARGKWVRAQVTSTQLSSYFVGATAWRRLREQARARQGQRYNEGAFHAEALSHGAPPVHRLPELMSW